MNRYLLFGGESYYPGGGWGDFLGDFDETPQPVEVDDWSFVKGGFKYTNTSMSWGGQKYDWLQVVDTHTLDVVTCWRGGQRKDPAPTANATG
jgi:hypothetical protein